MAAISLRQALFGSVSALILSVGAAHAENQSSDGVNTEADTMIEATGSPGFAFTAETMGTAAEALVGMNVGDVAGMEVFDESGEKIGQVTNVAEAESGAPYLIVETEGNSSYMAPGQHAVPVPAFDYSEEANGLVLRTDYATGPGASVGMGAAAPGQEWTRLYTVLDADQSIGDVSIESYHMVAETEQDEIAETYEDSVAYGGDARSVLESEGITEIEGRDVYSSQNEDIGDVYAVAHDGQGNLYLIVSMNDGVLGVGDSERVTPLDAFNYSVEEEAFIFTEGGEADMQSLPEWDSDGTHYAVIESDLDWSAYRQSEMADGSSVVDEASEAVDETAEALGEAVDESADAVATATEDTADTIDEAVDETADAVATATEDTTETVGDAGGNARQALADQGVVDLEGIDILDVAKTDIGTVEDVAVNGQADLFLIISLDDGVIGMGDSERAVKLDAFDYSVEDEAFVLRDTSEAALEAMPEWDTDDPNYVLIDSEVDWSEFK